MAAGTTLTELLAKLNTFRADGKISGPEIDDLIRTLYNILSSTDTTTLNLEWSGATTYDTPATAETSGNPAYAEFGDRLWKSKTDGNLNNQPPTDPGTTETANWLEVSKATANPIKEWEAGAYFSGLIIVFHNDALYKLTVATRPYESTDIDAEITAGDWVKISGNTDILYDLFDVALSTTTITLDLNNQRMKNFKTDTAHSANFNIAKSNEVNAAGFYYKFETSATNIVVSFEDGTGGTTEDTFPPDESQWDDVNKQLTIADAGHYEIIGKRISTTEFSLTVKKIK